MDYSNPNKVGSDRSSDVRSREGLVDKTGEIGAVKALSSFWND